jgi:hypothetical protein
MQGKLGPAGLEDHPFILDLLVDRQLEVRE